MWRNGTSDDGLAILKKAEEFVSGHRDSARFEHEFLAVLRQHDVYHNNEIGMVINELFYIVEDYWSELGEEVEEGSLNDVQLLEMTEKELPNLRMAIQTVRRREASGEV